LVTVYTIVMYQICYNKLIVALLVCYFVKTNGISWSSWEVFDNDCEQSNKNCYLQRTLLCGEYEGASCLSNKTDDLGSFQQIATESCNNSACLDDIEVMFPGPEVSNV